MMASSDEVSVSGEEPIEPGGRANEPGWRHRSDSWVPARVIARVIAIVGQVLLLAGLGTLLYETSLRVAAGNSDGATVVLEGQAVATGNVLLHGWALSLDSFWTIDAALDALGVRVGGLRPELMRLVPAVIALLVVFVAIRLAREDSSLTARITGVLTIIAILALPSPDLSYFFLQGPWHIGTALVCLLAFAGVSRGHFDWGWVAAVVLLAAAILGDSLTIAYGVVPSILAGVIAMARCRRFGPGASTVAAGVASVALALALRALATLVGTFALVNRNVPIKTSQLLANLRLLANHVPALLGVGSLALRYPDGSPITNGSSLLQHLHLLELGVILLAVLLTLARLVFGVVAGSGRATVSSQSWRLDDLLVISIVGDVGSYVLAAGNDNPQYAKYLTPGVIFATVLAGRLLGRLVGRVDRRWVLRGLVIVSFGVVASFGVGTWQLLARPAVHSPVDRLSAFLLGHHLTEGIGDYWSASIVTVESRGRVVIRPVTATGPAGHLRRYGRQSFLSWYAGHSFQFLVYDSSRPWRHVDATTAEHTFASPAKTYVVGSYRVLTWSRPITVSTAVPRYGRPLKLFFRLGE